jgi:anti-sigma factor ChrR (cupin superfamily)
MSPRSDSNARERDECPWRDTAHSFVLGILAPGEEAGFSEHLLEGCGGCGRELEEARREVADLDHALAHRSEASSPARAVRARAVAELAAAPARKTPFSSLFGSTERGSGTPRVPSSLPGVSLVLDSEEGWLETPCPGVSFKTLFEDRERRYATALVRMAPGSSYPSHRHAGVEECFVIAGEVSLADHDFRPGDYLVSEAGSTHPPHTTREGCVLLIVSSQDDELLEG